MKKRTHHRSSISPNPLSHKSAADATPSTPSATATAPAATPAGSSAVRGQGVIRGWLNDLSKIEAFIAALSLVLAAAVFVFTSFDGLRTAWNFLWHRPLDVSLRPTADQLDVLPGKAFTARVAVENYTDWYKPYVKLTASLESAANPATPTAPDTLPPPRLDPTDFVRIDPGGRVYVEVAARINVPGRYVLTVRARPLYRVPPPSVRRENQWPAVVAATAQEGEPAVCTVAVVAHGAEDFGPANLVEVRPDTTNCVASVTFTAGQSYPYGLRITARTRRGSRTWFDAVDPTVGTPEATADTADAAIANGAYIKWKVDHTEALETREFTLFLSSHIGHDEAQWKGIIKDILFSAEALRSEEKP